MPQLPGKAASKPCEALNNRNLDLASILPTVIPAKTPDPHRDQSIYEIWELFKTLFVYNPPTTSPLIPLPSPYIPMDPQAPILETPSLAEVAEALARAGAVLRVAGMA